MIGSIVLAEDSLEHCFFFVRALKEVAPEIKFAAVHDGEKLIELLDSYLPDLLCLDRGLRSKNGIESIREVRYHRQYDSLPIIVFSVNGDEPTIQASYRYGANLYIVKPSEYLLLRSFFKKILSIDWSDPGTVTEHYFEKNRFRPLNDLAT